MNGLYPIIRRVRRPLVPVEVLPNGQQADAKAVVAVGQAAIKVEKEKPATVDAGNAERGDDAKTEAGESN